MLDPTLERRLARVLEANRRVRDPQLSPANRARLLGSLQRWQSARLARSFADFLADPVKAPAARFFLDDLYGDHDVTARDRGVERVLPLMQRILPAPLLDTAADAIELAALSHAFDLRMAVALQQAEASARTLDVAHYADAYRRVGRPLARAHQIRLILAIGRDLDRVVRKPWLWRLLRASRLPAKLAGLSDLQGFLERGFDAFRQLGGAHDFLGAIAAREQDSMERLFAGEADPFRFGDGADLSPRRTP